MQLKYLMALLLPALAAAGKSVNYIVTFQPDTPDEVIRDCMAAVKANGGQITHEYTIIRGFSALAPEAAVNQVSTMASEWKPVIEEDSVVSQALSEIFMELM
ncbi:hypothetical protein L873DRAFT_1700776 [Choiromyces venosus 120613-1]|uniref:Inhibitor I9 domain-containing protein n=1 Tax=Choiromyces venosus 120613-1 TaxID=1336337 RepID=A0A3N4JE40_9PEZI|nr:hypothetical protein L873DRAFT_1700776 [Choiromyces venosus 120613-1]